MLQYLELTGTNRSIINRKETYDFAEHRHKTDSKTSRNYTRSVVEIITLCGA